MLKNVFYENFLPLLFLSYVYFHIPFTKCVCSFIFRYSFTFVYNLVTSLGNIYILSILSILLDLQTLIFDLFAGVVSEQIGIWGSYMFGARVRPLIIKRQGRSQILFGGVFNFFCMGKEKRLYFFSKALEMNEKV